jgi:alpha-ketoglutarate-dependent taurine dioxygenase
MKIENAVPHIGALVTGLDVKRMTNSEWQTLYQTWLDRHVLIVRGQDLSKADFLAYSRRFGRLKSHMIKRTRDPGNPEITLMGVTSMAKDSGGAALILNRGEGWHTDSPWDTEICKGTQLYGIEIPSYGGDTLFASMHAAFDALPERLKERIAPLKVAFRYGGRERKNGSICSSPRIRRGRRRCTTWCAFTARPGENRSTSIRLTPSASSAWRTPKPIACSRSCTGTCCSPTPVSAIKARRASPRAQALK